MRKYIIALAFLICLLIPSLSFAATQFVSPTGGHIAVTSPAETAPGPCGTDANCLSIAAHDASTFSPDDIIRMCPGTYQGANLDVPSSGSADHPIIYMADSGTPILDHST